MTRTTLQPRRDPITARLDGAPGATDPLPTRVHRRHRRLGPPSCTSPRSGSTPPKLNGRHVHDHVLAPGWTSYHHRLRFQIASTSPTCSATAANCLGITVAEGWYRGRLGFGGGVREVYGADIGADRRARARVRRRPRPPSSTDRRNGGPRTARS